MLGLIKCGDVIKIASSSANFITVWIENANQFCWSHALVDTQSTVYLVFQVRYKRSYAEGGM